MCTFLIKSSIFYCRGKKQHFHRSRKEQYFLQQEKRVAFLQQEKKQHFHRSRKEQHFYSRKKEQHFFSSEKEQHLYIRNNISSYETVLQERRPYLATECDDLHKCEKWRRQIIGEVSRKVAQIQNGNQSQCLIMYVSCHSSPIFQLYKKKFMEKTREAGKYTDHLLLVMCTDKLVSDFINFNQALIAIVNFQIHIIIT